VPIREISRQIGFNESSVRRFVKKYQQDHSLKRKKGTRLKKCTTVREDRVLKKLSLQERFETAPQLKASFQEATGVIESVRTMQNCLNEMSLMARRPVKKPLLTNEMKKKIVQTGLRKREIGL
jgi:DNA-binding Lrp family transcriptional regulator